MAFMLSNHCESSVEIVKVDIISPTGESKLSLLPQGGELIGSRKENNIKPGDVIEVNVLGKSYTVVVKQGSKKADVVQHGLDMMDRLQEGTASLEDLNEICELLKCCNTQRTALLADNMRKAFQDPTNTKYLEVAKQMLRGMSFSRDATRSANVILEMMQGTREAEEALEKARSLGYTYVTSPFLPQSP